VYKQAAAATEPLLIFFQEDITEAEIGAGVAALFKNDYQYKNRIEYQG